MSDKITYGIIGLLFGATITWSFVATNVNSQYSNIMGMMGADHMAGISMMNSDMMKNDNMNSQLHNSHHPDTEI